ncbi:hypothetical protein CPT03_12030 [Pedobacter ginsengisoli]|uniref:Uncharacterized protein n=1 Tax=Pedobacter ginsengisoli TaxID=363852 RepID=A0A2D1U6C7_9SPHI|nr:DUF932 domain-containing protein [Pedobacter ginsengisoli]ATP57148.1 hypothetical protein CPT03_12030 [Pedobacter ginsengisoli]
MIFLYTSALPGSGWNFSSIRLKHTANVQDRLKVVHQLLGLSNRLADEMENIFNHWALVRIR